MSQITVNGEILNVVIKDGVRCFEVAEAAKYLGIKRAKLYDLVYRKGKIIPTGQDKGRNYFSIDYLDDVYERLPTMTRRYHRYDTNQSSDAGKAKSTQRAKRSQQMDFA